MNKKRKYRLYAIFSIMLGLSLTAGLTMYALRQNISLFYTPTQVVKGEVVKGKVFRVGGLVIKGSLSHIGNGLKVRFTLTDTKHQVTVNYQGILPDLFREGQGIVASGQLNKKGIFIANQVLAKHDENYMPPEVKMALEKASK